MIHGTNSIQGSSEGRRPGRQDGGWEYGEAELLTLHSLDRLKQVATPFGGRSRGSIRLVLEGEGLVPAVRSELASRFATTLHGESLSLRLNHADIDDLAEIVSETQSYGDIWATRAHGHDENIDAYEGIRGRYTFRPEEAYFTNAETTAWMEGLAERFPGHAKVFDLSALPGASKTHEGRSIQALRLTKGVDRLDPDKPADKPAIVIASQHHSRELNSAVMSLYAMRRIAEGAADPESSMAKLLEDYEVFIIPTVNPDGVERVWTKDNMHRKNGRVNKDGSVGVDTNRNYGFLFGRCGASSVPSSQTYKGEGPYSEPETQTMRALGQWSAPVLYFDFHSYGQEVLSLYPRCATVHPNVMKLGQHYADDLRHPMNYSTRPPSASAEAPHDFWAHGAMSFLIEVGRGFQPPFHTTVTEEERVWPGMEKALTTWKPARLGTITDTMGEPVAAEIEVEDIFFEGEKTISRSSDGKFGLWLPKGKHTIVVRAEGYDDQRLEVEVKDYNEGLPLDIELAPFTGPEA